MRNTVPAFWLVITLVGCGDGAQQTLPDSTLTDVPTDTIIDSSTDVPTDTPTDGCVTGSCPTGQQCIDGVCRHPCAGGAPCPTGQECCDDWCYNTSIEPDHCGGCDNSCAPGGNMCIAGTCSCNGAAACSSGLTCCEDGGCLDTTFDRFNCGGCGIVCPDVQQCIGGICGGSCAEHGCPEVPHGTASCEGDVCVITDCDDGWADGDGIFENGCECAAEADDNGGPTCEAAYDLGTVSDAAPGSEIVIEGFISDFGPEDWYVFTATDTPDTSCDEFHVDIRFDINPGDTHVFDVYITDCTPENLVCEDDTEFDVALDFTEVSGDELIGECPCSVPAGDGATECSDNTATYYLQVHLADGMTTSGCEPYEITVSNGVY